LSLAFMLVTLTTALLVAVFLRLTGVRQVERLLDEQQINSYEEVLAAYYTANDSWQGVEDYVEQVWGGSTIYSGALNDPGSQPPADPASTLNQPRFPSSRHESMGLADVDGTVIIAMPPEYPRGAHVSSGKIKRSEAVEVNGKVVGYILANTQPPGLTHVELAYLERTNLALWVASGLAVVFAAIIGFVLARRLTRSVRQLTQAAGEVARGNLGKEVEVNTQDEIGQLSVAFNRMSRQLAHANNLRRQMTADVAHDLRTPLTVMAGYVEAMQDGTLSATPERLGLIYSEIEHLQSLVDDLRLLSQADAGEVSFHLQPVNPGEMIKHMAELFQNQAQRKGVTISILPEKDLPMLLLDEDRMAQVFSNLVSNSLRYTHEGGKIDLSAVRQDKCIIFSVQDDGPGIPEKALPSVFDRFYRVDPSRHDEEGSGLGLAIARALVEGQRGAIHAESQEGKGTRILMTFPIDESLQEKMERPGDDSNPAPLGAGT